MKVIITAGGTGGHIMPALAIIEKIKEKEPNSEFLYIGTHNRMEKDIIPKMGIRYEELKIYGLQRKITVDNFKNVNYLYKAIKKAKKMIKEFEPDIVIGVGGYVTAPVIYAANSMNYKTFIHEQNSLPGLANRFISKKSNVIGISFKKSAQYFSTDNVVYTGNPCSEKAITVEAIDKTELGLSVDKKLVLIVMGSLGSGAVNSKLNDAIKKFEGKDYEVLFVTGKKYYDDVIEKLEIPSNVKVVPYVDELVRVIKVTDLIISRAGASTMSEITALKVPSILIPSPYVTGDHQMKNAMDLKIKKAALILPEKELTAKKLVNMIDKTLKDENKLEKMRKNLDAFFVPDSASRIYKITRDLIDGK